MQPACELSNLDVGDGSFAAALINFSVERYFLTFRKAVDAGALKRCRMYEHVLVAVVRCDKAVAFLVVVELNSAAFHGVSSSKLRFVCADAARRADQQ